MNKVTLESIQKAFGSFSTVWVLLFYSLSFQVKVSIGLFCAAVKEPNVNSYKTIA